jgi:signal transduction histidine kinase
VDKKDTQSALQTQRQALTDAQKLASVGRLAASRAHEIRNPLTAMKMWLHSARDTTTAGAEVARTLDCVTQEVRRLEAIVRQFLEFSRPPETRLTWTPTADLVADCAALVEPLLREKSITLTSELSANLPKLFVDREQLKRVVVNLLRNSAESLPPGGRISVSAAKQIDTKGHPEAILRICDDGPGIPPALQMILFEPFFTTKNEGTGLGLAIVASIVVRHGGRVELDSAADGAAFVVYLPLPEETDRA